MKVSRTLQAMLFLLANLAAWSTAYAATPKVEAGVGHTVLLKNDGTVWTSGENSEGQLGDGTTTTRLAPVQTIWLAGVTDISAGDTHTLALRGDGTVWAWGGNAGGQLGINDVTRAMRKNPILVPGLTGVVSVAAGQRHSLALKNDGTVWSWGENSNGQLGDGTRTDRLTPIQVSGLTGVVALAAGCQHSLAVKNDGTVWAWGDNTHGQLGDGTVTERPTPIQIPGLTGITTLAAGKFYSIALRSDGTVWAWGYNTTGQLGTGNQTASYTPVLVNGLANIIAITAGHDHTVALNGNGTVWTWGLNDRGQLGDGTTNFRSVPTLVPGLTGATNISAGLQHSVVLKSGGACLAWGSNDTGQLGDGSTVERHTPVEVLGRGGIGKFFASSNALSSGFHHSLSLRSDGTVLAWGDNSNFALGYSPVYDNYSNAANPVNNLGSSSAVAAGGWGFSLAISNVGTVWAWGDNSNGQLGDGTTTNRAQPVKTVNLTNIVEVCAAPFAGSHALALKNDGTVWAWGSNGSGQLGNGTTTRQLTPVQVTGLDNIVAIAAGSAHSLALKNDGTVWAWGANSNGQLGDGTTTKQITPVKVNGIENIRKIAAGENHSLALKNDGTVWAWGENSNGKLGDGTTTNRPAPVQVSGLTNVVSVSGGVSHSLAVKGDGTLWSWGSNQWGQLGDGTFVYRQIPVLVSSLTDVQAAAAGTNSVALKSDGSVWACGTNSSGQLGSNCCAGSMNTPVQSIVPGGPGSYLSLRLPVPDALPPTAISTSGYTANWSTIPGATSYSFKSNSDPTFNATSLSGSPRTLSGMAPGTTHDYRIRAYVNYQYGEYSNQIRLATLSPGVTITGLPTSPTSQSSVSLTIGGAEVATYKYRVDGESWSAAHPVSDALLIYGLADGQHTVTVAYANEAGQWQQLETTGTWTVQDGTRTYPKVDFVSPGLTSPGWPEPFMQITSIQGTVVKALNDYWSYQFVEGDRRGKFPSPAPHRSGRAPLRHPAPLFMVLLHDGR
ncbi:MAG: hypothetical protein ACP59X_02605 [Solidesulfovibrio sp. DCME]|uniref:RCC1 domain-containing protein n=1 Tax=Solidesulfovibrio sp. DCME TaxID=3447380 RepID=UPI003D0E8D69